jgi:hypothetical protein
MIRPYVRSPNSQSRGHSCGISHSHAQQPTGTELRCKLSYLSSLQKLVRHSQRHRHHRPPYQISLYYVKQKREHSPSCRRRCSDRNVMSHRVQRHCRKRTSRHYRQGGSERSVDNTLLHHMGPRKGKISRSPRMAPGMGLFAAHRPDGHRVQVHPSPPPPAPSPASILTTCEAPKRI